MSTPRNLTRTHCVSLRKPCALLEYALLRGRKSGQAISKSYDIESGIVTLRLIYEFGVPFRQKTTVKGYRPDFAWLDRCPFCGVELQPVVISEGTVQDEPSEKPDAHGEVSA